MTSWHDYFCQNRFWKHYFPVVWNQKLSHPPAFFRFQTSAQWPDLCMFLKKKTKKNLWIQPSDGRLWTFWYFMFIYLFHFFSLIIAITAWFMVRFGRNNYDKRRTLGFSVCWNKMPSTYLRGKKQCKGTGQKYR